MKLNNAPVVRTEAVDNAKEMTSRNFFCAECKNKVGIVHRRNGQRGFFFLFLFMVLKHATLVLRFRISAVTNPLTHDKRHEVRGTQSADELVLHF